VKAQEDFEKTNERLSDAQKKKAKENYRLILIVNDSKKMKRLNSNYRILLNSTYKFYFNFNFINRKRIFNFNAMLSCIEICNFIE
jgi:ssRNA-specific RNase YbeY (16S rRNA maturation enzyme)